mmetsp:Transcript_27229/g.93593  ORF Transcript_27229/g.93593 Transcript_27229/m.93593 type:complete len:500 (+) Transcript_27229:549-2048(+)
MSSCRASTSAAAAYNSHRASAAEFARHFAKATRDGSVTSNDSCASAARREESSLQATSMAKRSHFENARRSTQPMAVRHSFGAATSKSRRSRTACACHRRQARERQRSLWLAAAWSQPAARRRKDADTRPWRSKAAFLSLPNADRRVETASRSTRRCMIRRAVVAPRRRRSEEACTISVLCRKVAKAFAARRWAILRTVTDATKAPRPKSAKRRFASAENARHLFRARCASPRRRRLQMRPAERAACPRRASQRRRNRAPSRHFKNACDCAARARLPQRAARTPTRLTLLAAARAAVASRVRPWWMHVSYQARQARARPALVMRSERLHTALAARFAIWSDETLRRHCLKALASSRIDSRKATLRMALCAFKARFAKRSWARQCAQGDHSAILQARFSTRTMRASSSNACATPSRHCAHPAPSLACSKRAVACRSSRARAEKARTWDFHFATALYSRPRHIRARTFVIFPRFFSSEACALSHCRQPSLSSFLSNRSKIR